MPVYAILILLIFIFLIILFLCAFLTYRKFLKENLLPAPASSRLENLNQFLLPTGFQYNSANDYFYAAMDCWQRSCGYCRLYDESDASFSMVIDSEPIYFDYGGRRWLIEFWKGQYGMTAGAEVGIYATDKKDLHIPGVFDGPFFEAVSDEELLPIRRCPYIVRRTFFLQESALPFRTLKCAVLSLTDLRTQVMAIQKSSSGI